MGLHPPVNISVLKGDGQTYADGPVGAFFFFGCMLMTLGAVGEWIVGNTFPFVVFGTFGEPDLQSHGDQYNL